MKNSLLLFLVLASTGLFCQDHNMYIPYRSKNLWGYADTSGKIVIQPKWTIEPDFFDGYGFARVYGTLAGKRVTGVVNAQGKELAAVKYEEVNITPYLIGVKTNGRYDIMNVEGKKLNKQVVTKYACSLSYALAGKNDSVSFYRYDAKSKTLRKISSYGHVAKFYFSGPYIEIRYDKTKSSVTKWYDTLGKFVMQEDPFGEPPPIVDMVMPREMHDMGVAEAPKICKHLGTVFASCNKTGQKYYIMKKHYYLGVVNDSCRIMLPFEYDRINCFYHPDCYDSYDGQELIFSVQTGMDRIPSIITTSGRKTTMRYSSIEATGEAFRYKTSRNNLYGLIYVTPSYIYETAPAFKDIYKQRMMGDMVLYRIRTTEGKTGFINDRGRIFFD